MAKGWPYIRLWFQLVIFRFGNQLGILFLGFLISVNLSSSFSEYLKCEKSKNNWFHSLFFTLIFRFQHFFTRPAVLFKFPRWYSYRFLNIAPIRYRISHSFILYLCTPDPSCQLNRHCSRVVVVLGISLLYFIYTFRSLLYFFPLGNSTKKAAIFTRQHCPHLSSFFFSYILFFISFMLRTCDLWTWRG